MLGRESNFAPSDLVPKLERQSSSRSAEFPREFPASKPTALPLNLNRERAASTLVDGNGQDVDSFMAFRWKQEDQSGSKGDWPAWMLFA